MEARDGSVRSMAGLNFLFGVWLIISPYILSYDTASSKWQQTIAGIVVVLASAVRYFAVEQVWASWVNVLAGLWMIITPFASNFQPMGARWNAVIFGILVGIIGLTNASQHHAAAGHTGRHHHAM